MDFCLSDGGRKAAGYKTTKPYSGDCVVRSISIVTQIPYKQVFTELSELALEMGGYPNWNPVWQKYLKTKGYFKNRCPRDHQGKLIKLKNWEWYGSAVVLNSGHLTAVVEGVLYDSWDCRYRQVNSYWTNGLYVQED